MLPCAPRSKRRAFGLIGKTCIDEAQIAAINADFSAGDEELAWATKITDASDTGAVFLDGEFVDLPVANRAARILARIRF